MYQGHAQTQCLENKMRKKQDYAGPNYSHKNGRKAKKQKAKKKRRVLISDENVHC